MENSINTEMVSISKVEYDKLKHDSYFLNALYNAGVDNWDGFEIAVENVEDFND